MSGLKYWLWLTTRRGLDAAGVLTVLDYFVTPERAYYADTGRSMTYCPLHPRRGAGCIAKSLTAPIGF